MHDLERQRRRIETIIADRTSSARMVKHALATRRQLDQISPETYSAVRNGAARVDHRPRPGREGAR